MDKKESGPVRTAGYILEAVLVITLGTFFSLLPKTVVGSFGFFVRSDFVPTQQKRQEMGLR